MKNNKPDLKNTPWGQSDYVKEIAPGIYDVSTPGHGGIYVSDEQLHRIPKEEQALAKGWSGSSNWYEEDCCALSVLKHIPEARRANHTEEMISAWWAGAVQNQLTRTETAAPAAYVISAPEIIQEAARQKQAGAWMIENAAGTVTATAPDIGSALIQYAEAAKHGPGMSKAERGTFIHQAILAQAAAPMAPARRKAQQQELIGIFTEGL